MTESIRIKPHHMIDIISTEGAGKTAFGPHPYGHALHLVTRQILDDTETLLTMALGADDICSPCKHNIDGVCGDVIDTSFRPAAPAAKGEWNLLLDRRWCERLGFQQGDQLTARRFCRRVAEMADDITDIYREEPAARTANRAANLKRGLETFL